MSTSYISEIFGTSSYFGLLPDSVRVTIMNQASSNQVNLPISDYTCSKCEKRWITTRYVAAVVVECGCCYEQFRLCDACYPKHRDEFGHPNHRRRAYLKFRERSKAARKARRLAEIASRNRVKYVIPELDLSFYPH